MRWLLVFAAACSFEPGKLPALIDDAPVAPGDGDAQMIIDAQMIDMAPPADARMCPMAPSGCALFTCATSSSCYYICGTATTGKQSYAGARTSCTNVSLGCIVTVNDQLENNCIAAATAPLFPDAMVWLGYEQASGANEPDEGWSWRCPPSSYTAPNWGDPNGEPNDDGGGEDCTTMIQGGAWIDATCSGSARFVCELP